MKKALLVVLIVAGGVTASFAQVGFGVKAGYNLATVHADEGNNPITWNGQSGFHAGILVNFPVILGLSVQPEVVYSGEGGKFNDDGDAGTLKNGLVNLPVMVKYKLHGFFVE